MIVARRVLDHDLDVVEPGAELFGKGLNRVSDKALELDPATDASTHRALPRSTLAFARDVVSIPLNRFNRRAKIFEYSAEVRRGDPKATAEYNFWITSDFAGCRRNQKRPSAWSLLVFRARLLVTPASMGSVAESLVRNRTGDRNAKVS